MDMADKAVLYSCLCFFREFGEVGAAKPDVVRLSEEASAASRRLCVETGVIKPCSMSVNQPPLGGCVLKHRVWMYRAINKIQPPLGGCVLKHLLKMELNKGITQPPLGGCVLKQECDEYIASNLVSRL